jgi:hypothetical protein
MIANRILKLWRDYDKAPDFEPILLALCIVLREAEQLRKDVKMSEITNGRATCTFSGVRMCESLDGLDELVTKMERK